MILRFFWKDELTPKAKRVAEQFRPALIRGMRRAGAILWREWGLQISGPRSATRLGRVTGALFGSIKQREERGGMVQVVGMGERYGVVHERGAVIVPVRAKALRFVVGGRVVFARRVVIPKRPHLAPAFARARGPILQTLRAAVREGLDA